MARKGRLERIANWCELPDDHPQQWKLGQHAQRRAIGGGGGALFVSMLPVSSATLALIRATRDSIAAIPISNNIQRRNDGLRLTFFPAGLSIISSSTLPSSRLIFTLTLRSCSSLSSILANLCPSISRLCSSWRDRILGSY